MRRPFISMLILMAAAAAVTPLPSDAASTRVPMITVPRSAATLAMATADSKSEIHLTNIRVNGQSISQPVAPGSTVQISFDVSLSEVSGCPACVIQAYIGFQGTAATCFIPFGAEGDTESRTIALTAPSRPGTYLIMVNETLQPQCVPVTSGGDGLSSIAAVVATVKVK
jgi:hypothetical protein